MPEGKGNAVKGALKRAALWFAALSMVFSCASPGVTLFDLTPAEGDVASTSLLEGSLVFSARYLDARERTLYLREAGWEQLGRGLSGIPMVTFALTVKNDSSLDLTLDPKGVRLAVGIGPMLSPYNYAHLYMELPRSIDRQETLADLRKAVFDKLTVIGPGESRRKLLLFKRPEKVGPEVAVYFGRLFVAGRTYTAGLDFVAVDLED